MKRFGWVALASLAACSGSSGTTSGATGSSVTTGAATSSGTTTGAAGTTGTNGATGTTGGLPTCAQGYVWAGDVCLQQVCTAASVDYSICLLGDGGVGYCVNSGCVNLEADPNNCGLLGATCALGSTCVQGICLFSDGGALCDLPSPCGTGMTCDYLGCISEACTAGAPDNTACSDGGFSGTCCGGTCISPDTAQNCGGCGQVCATGTSCVNGVCTPPCGPDNTPCTYNGGPAFCCNGTCTPAGSDPSNCVACGASCPSGDECGFFGIGDMPPEPACVSLQSGATPTCPVGETLIGTSCTVQKCYCVPSSACSGTSTDSCVVTVDGQTSWGICCGDDCVDTQTDSQNCGGCNLVCPSGTTCAEGLCGVQPSCAVLPNGTACADAGPGGLCCSGTCVDNLSDNANCGGCGLACATGQTCVRGTQNALPYGTCQFGCGGTDCPTGTACSNGSCTPVACAGLYDGTPCSAVDGGGICCSAACVALDTSNCGACGVGCPSGFTCVDGDYCAQGTNQEACAAGCPAGTACVADSVACEPTSCAGRTDGDVCAAGPDLQGTCCSGICAATSEDPANCGGCGLSCAGACQGAQCLADLPQACLQSCPAGTLCVNGACVGSICSGQSSCLAEDGVAGQCCGNACADLATDTLNCGACGIACTSGACSGGKCPGVRCSAANQGVFCETGEATDICCGTACIDSATDPNNCGGCGVTCGLGACDAGSCVP